MCMFCKCDTVTPSLTTHVVNYNGAIIVIKNVPCEECEQCGEKFYTDDVAEKLEKMVNAAKQMMQEMSCCCIMIRKRSSRLKLGCGLQMASWRAFCVKTKF